MRRLIFIFLAAVSLCLPVLAAQPVAAFDPFGSTKAECQEVNADSSPCTSDPNQGNPLAGPDGILIKVTNLLAVAGGVAAVIMIMINGIRFILSGGNPDRVSGARDGVVYSVIGLIVIIAARSIIVFVLNRL